MPLKKIVYLLGAGASHAEILNVQDEPSQKLLSKNGLLISHVSERVMKAAQISPGFKSNVEFVTSAEGSLNIELLISLLASNQIPNVDQKVNVLKRLVQSDIMKILSPNRKQPFYLHKALLELHSLVEDRENLLGIISLNYDDILDEAYQANRVEIDYCHTPHRGEKWPLLKLHGSFNWTKITTYGRAKAIPIIPLGINKNYLAPPYNFIWGKAFDILAQCHVLRIIGCSLDRNDIGLIDLLFKVHLEKADPIEMQVIDFQGKADEIKKNYGFFPGIVKPRDIERSLIADGQILSPDLIGNPFKIWLKAKAERMLGDGVRRTKYLRKCFDI